MKHTKTLYRTLALTTAACLLCFTIASAKKPTGTGGGGGTSYKIIRLADPDVNVHTWAWDMNNNFQVVGLMDDQDRTGNSAAVHWQISTVKGETQSTARLLAEGLRANGINDFNKIVGIGDDSLGRYWDGPADEVSRPNDPLTGPFFESKPTTCRRLHVRRQVVGLDLVAVSLRRKLGSKIFNFSTLVLLDSSTLSPSLPNACLKSSPLPGAIRYG